MHMLSLKSILVSMLIMLPAFVSAQDSIRTNKIVVTDTINKITKVDTHKNRFIKRLKQKRMAFMVEMFTLALHRPLMLPKK